MSRHHARKISHAFRPRLINLDERIVPSVVLSDNLSNSTTGTEAATGTHWLTSSFATDSSSHSLTSITLRLSNPISGTATLALYSNGGLQPGSLVGTLTSPASYSSTLANT